MPGAPFCLLWGMDYRKSLSLLKAFVKEVKDYYDGSKQQPNGPFVISEQMVGLALPTLSKAELNGFIMALATEGQITVVGNAPLRFTPDLLIQRRG